MAKIDLTNEGANALREFAKSMPVAVDTINEGAQTLKSVLASNESRLGEHVDSYAEIVNLVTAACTVANAAIGELPAKLNKVADEIDAFVATSVTVEG